MSKNKHQPDNLDRQVAKQVSLWISSLAILILTISIGFSLYLYHQSDREYIMTKLSKVQSQLDNELSVISTVVRDYAAWDDANDYTRSQDNTFVTNNFSANYMGYLNLNFAIIMSAPKQVLFATERLHQQKQHVTMPMHNDAILTRLANLEEWRTGFTIDKTTDYITMIDDKVTFLSIAGITDTQRQMHPKVMLILGRYLDSESMAKLERLTGVNISLSVSPPSLPSWQWQQQIAYKQLPNTPEPIWLTVSKSMDWQPRVVSIVALIGAVLLAMISCSWAVKRSIRQLVLARINTFVNIAQQSDDCNAKRWPDYGHNELDELANAFNNLLGRLTLSRRRLKRQAVTDALTELSNRHALEKQLTTPLSAQEQFCMLIMDIDSFKLVNDSLGHAAGDQLLKVIARRLRDNMRDNDSIYRIGGDEFVVLLPQCNVEQALLRANQLLHIIEQPVLFVGNELKMSCSIGVAKWIEGIDGNDAMRHADLAMYTAKHAGKGRVCLYHKDMNDYAQQKLALEQALHIAITEQQIEPWFQPIVNSTTNKTVSMELLARWQHNDQAISPAIFIPLAEELGVVGYLFEQLLNKGLKVLTQQRNIVPDLTLSINLSPLQLTDTTLVAKILSQLAANDLPPEALAVEITESAMLEHPEQAEQSIQALVAAGVSIYLDDFGTGYSSMARLNELHFDVIKLDRSFVQLLNRGDSVLTCAVYNLSKNLNIKIIAEGVENETERKMLSAIGYQEMQGFLFAQPMPPDELNRWMAQQN